MSLAWHGGRISHPGALLALSLSDLLAEAKRRRVFRTAGVYLVGRFYPVFVPEVLMVIAICGVITLFMAATIAITATDIKRVLAYSTISQLGYMMMALGVGGWAAGLLHLITHAFFKSLLFMCSGSVIHAVHTNEMTEMGGLRKTRG